MKFLFLDYSSTSSFFVNDHSIITSSTLELKAFESISSGDNFNRIYQLVNSAATQKHLIEKFNLIKHYNIDSTNEFYLQKTIEQVRAHITVKKSPYNSISVTVRDRHRYLSAEMANEIVSFIETLNQDFYLKNLENKVLISQAYVKQLEHENKMKSAGIDSIIQKINLLLSNGRLSDRNSYSLLLHQQKLSELISVLQTSANDFINSQKLYNLSLHAMNFKSFPTITVLQTAMPAVRSVAIAAFLISLLVMVLTAMLLVLQAYLYLHYKNYLMNVFSDK